MLKKELKLDIIESGRMADNEMNKICAGEIFCGTYAICKKEFGKWSCAGYINCEDPNDPNKRNTCGTYKWVAEISFETSIIAN